MKQLQLFFFLLAAFMPLVSGAAERYLYITRHGQPELKKKQKPYKGDIPLSDLGRLQSSKLGKYLKQLKFNGKIYVSPYLRTVETGVGIGKELGLPVIPFAPIQERVADHRKGNTSIANLPNMKSGGYMLEELRKKFPGGIADEAELKFPWLLTEPEDYYTTHAARVGAGVRQILARQPQGDILLVCHAGSVQGLAKYLTPEGEKMPKFFHWNCCLVVYKVADDGKITFEKFVQPTEYLTPAEITSNKLYYTQKKKK